MPEITVDQFFQTEIRVGRIIKAEDFPKAKKPAYKLQIDFGELGIKTSSAQITKRYSKEDLQDRLIIAVTNFPPRKIADFVSQVLVLGVEVAPGDIALLSTESCAPIGHLIS